MAKAQSYVRLPGNTVRLWAEQTVAAIERKREREKQNRVEDEITRIVESNKKRPRWFQRRVPSSEEVRQHFYKDHSWFPTFWKIDNVWYSEDYDCAKRLARVARFAPEVSLSVEDADVLGRWHAAEVVDRILESA